jgi:hypothetical protein
VTLKKTMLVMTVVVIGAIAPSCKDECAKLRLAQQLACSTDPKSVECKEATDLIGQYCQIPGPVPTPTPVSTPTPPPPPPEVVTCADITCSEGYACEETSAGPRCFLLPTPPPPPPPPPSGCNTQERELEAVGDCGTSMQDKLAEVTADLGDPTGNDPQDTLKIVALELGRRGVCAIAGIEAVFIRNSRGLWEEYHVVYFGSGGWANSGRGKYMGCHKDPQVVGCTAPVTPKVNRWNLKPHNRWYDSTPLFYGKGVDGYCALIGFPDRLFCPARSECPGFKCEERAACEAIGIGGAPLFRCEKGDAEVNPENPFQGRCFDSAWIEVCSADQTVCERVDIV